MRRCLARSSMSLALPISIPAFADVTVDGCLATFYSDDFGQHWKHLALMGRPVALGAPTGELVTAPADGYHATAPLRAYHLGG